MHRHRQKNYLPSELLKPGRHDFDSSGHLSSWWQMRLVPDGDRLRRKTWALQLRKPGRVWLKSQKVKSRVEKLGAPCTAGCPPFFEVCVARPAEIEWHPRTHVRASGIRSGGEGWRREGCCSRESSLTGLDVPRKWSRSKQEVVLTFIIIGWKGETMWKRSCKRASFLYKRCLFIFYCRWIIEWWDFFQKEAFNEKKKKIIG